MTELHSDIELEDLKLSEDRPSFLPVVLSGGNQWLKSRWKYSII